MYIVVVSFNVIKFCAFGVIRLLRSANVSVFEALPSYQWMCQRRNAGGGGGWSS